MGDNSKKTLNEEMAGLQTSEVINTDLASAAEDENFADPRFSDENDDQINVDDSINLDQGMEEAEEPQETQDTDVVLSNNDENDSLLQDQVANSRSEQLASENENDIDVADSEESVQRVSSQIGLVGEEPEAQPQGDTEQQEPMGEAQVQAASELNDRLLRLPLTRIKHIIKMDPDVTLASQEAVVTIAKAAELFIGALSRDASYKTIQGRRRVVLRKDLEHTMDTRECYAFLEGAVDS